MKPFILILTIIAIALGCKQKSSETNTAITTPPDSIMSIDSAGLYMPPSSMLDSIDRVNNASVIASGDDVTKAYVFLKDGDSTINLTANIRRDHRIFGYAQPSITAQKLLLFSVFTNDVENNPFGCKLGAYYDTNGMENMTIRYVATEGKFVKAIAVDKANNKTTLYFEKQWVTFE